MGKEWVKCGRRANIFPLSGGTSLTIHYFFAGDKKKINKIKQEKNEYLIIFKHEMNTNSINIQILL